MAAALRQPAAAQDLSSTGTAILEMPASLLMTASLNYAQPARIVPAHRHSKMQSAYIVAHDSAAVT